METAGAALPRCLRSPLARGTRRRGSLLQVGEGAPERDNAGAQVAASAPADDTLVIDEVGLRNSDGAERAADRAGGIARDEHVRPPHRGVLPNVRVVPFVHA